MKYISLIAAFLLISSCSTSQEEVTEVTTMLSSSDEDAAITHLNILYWQAPSTLNPYLSSGTKDIEAASMILEPLANYDENAEMVPVLAQEIPTLENGGISEDLKYITWKLKTDIVWSDNTPFTAHDVVFTADYCAHPQTGCSSSNFFEDVASVTALDDHTVQIEFERPKPHPYAPFVGAIVPVIQKMQFGDCIGIRAQECNIQNFAPIGTGPFKVAEFRANDVVSFLANELFREPGKPFFQSATLKGGGDAASAARAVLETGEFDYAWNLQVEPEIIEKMTEAGRGSILSGFGSQVERIIVNLTNEDPSLGPDKRSLYLQGENPHPFLSDPSVRKALSLAIDREILVITGYGPAGVATCNIVSAPAIYVSQSNEECKTQDLDEAIRLLDEAGWTSGVDGVRSKDGVRLSLLYQTSTNSVRQGNQALIKQMWQQIGVETELRNIDGAVFFGSDVASPDTFQKFYADVQMYTSNFDGTDPSTYLSGWRCSEDPGPHNNWGGNNIPRACSDEYDQLIVTLSSEADLEKRAEIAIRMNDIVVQSYWEIPLIHRAKVSAVSNSLQGVRMNGWDSELWNVADWHR